MAFRRSSILDKTDVIVVAISMATFRTIGSPPFSIAAGDRAEHEGQGYGGRLLGFKPDGAYRCLSYYFAQGNGCGYCGEASRDVDGSSSPTDGSQVAQVKDESRTFDVVVQCPGHAR